ncbi:MAG: sigma-70 family RNA polymerase sigma factor [Mediterranea massiliensis]|nr:sigma-70 family RNA polymerase sigma factor [Mediterranea massiliensis]
MKSSKQIHINNNREVSRIYNELRQGFFAYNRVAFPMLSEEEREEIYNDSFMALCNNIESGKLQQLTCSLQTYINQIGKNKSIDTLRRSNNSQEMPNYEIVGSGEAYFDIPDHDCDDITIEQKEEEIYLLVQQMENDTCRKILFGFYWHHYTMEMLAELLGFNSSDVAKTTKNRCFTKLRNAAIATFRKKGLI